MFFMIGVTSSFVADTLVELIPPVTADLIEDNRPSDAYAIYVVAKSFANSSS